MEIFAIIASFNCLLVVIIAGEDVEFNRRFTGVEFYPYLKAEGLTRTPSVASYTEDNIKTMLEVVSTKFSRVLTYSVDARIRGYEENNPYYHHIYARGRTAEMAARINRERNLTALTVLIGIFDGDHRQDSFRTEAEVDMALKAANAAEEIHPGTVEGLLLSNYNDMDLNWANRTLHWIQSIRNMTDIPDLKIGTRQNCSGIEEDSSEFEASEIWLLRRRMINESDIIVCHAKPNSGSSSRGPDYYMDAVRTKRIRERYDIQTVNPNIEVMWETSWMQSDKSQEQNFEELERFWKLVDEFASENNFSVWLNGAFNNPKYPYPTYLAWWDLTRNDLLNNVSGYVENVADKSRKRIDPIPNPTNSTDTGMDCNDQTNSSNITTDESLVCLKHKAHGNGDVNEDSGTAKIFLWKWESHHSILAIMATLLFLSLLYLAYRHVRANQT